MINNEQKHDSFIFMKVGNHAGETFEQILARKQKEFDKTGMTFWGYGGAACHPVNQVRPFAYSQVKKKGAIYLLMHAVKSNHDQNPLPAKEYSTDGVNWEPIPDGIVVTGSKYALVLDEIHPSDLEVDMNQFSVGIGPSKDKLASEYLTGRTDKACLEAVLGTTTKVDKPTVRKIDYTAQLQDPFAVLLRY
ncbi:hypothetical protein [Puia dinghuensis]|uniref:Uncharacterized protein n=1 Tax=Puia dinghuensis TaxID=1792502 RepID=A0A8J2UAC8_9BACT|nr:hypothetical protein [Puia dinghuensis]GGA90127.1 hypothetical protein GCM10011511_11710 [Puia dinghuensis]